MQASHSLPPPPPPGGCLYPLNLWEDSLGRTSRSSQDGGGCSEAKLVSSGRAKVEVSLVQLLKQPTETNIMRVRV